MTEHDDFGGLRRDLPGLLGRRRALTLMGGAGLALLVGCGSDSKATSSSSASSSTGSSSSSSSSAAATASAAASGDLTAIPEETAGPYPGDGSNGPNALTQSGVVRKDIRSSFGSSTTTAQGVPFGIVLKLVDAKTGSPLSGAAVYAWHCDRDGQYSMYSSAVTGENYLRGVQEAATDGTVTFQSIFPGCYSGRWPHIHFEVYPSLAEATRAGTPSATSQIALPKDSCSEVYATSGYSSSVRNLAGVSLQSDMVFSDSYEQELGTMSGTVADGLTVTLPVAV